MRPRAVEPESGLEPLLLDVRDVQRVLRCGRETALKVMYAAGPVRLGRSLRVRTEDLRRLVESMRQEAS